MRLTDRPVSWSTTNSRVISIRGHQRRRRCSRRWAAGSASVTAASEGVASQKVNVSRDRALLPGGRWRAAGGAAILQRRPDAQQDFGAAADSEPGDASGERLRSDWCNPPMRRRSPTWWRNRTGWARRTWLGGAGAGGMAGVGRRGGDARVSGQRPERGRHAAFRERRGAGGQSGAPGERRHPYQVGTARLRERRGGSSGVRRGGVFDLRRELRNGAELRQRRDLCGHGRSAQRAGVLRQRL